MHAPHADTAPPLAFESWGDPDGQPVVHFHGTPGSRLERYPDEELCITLGIRFLTFDRPGYGDMPPGAGWSLAACAQAVAAAIDAMGEDRVRLHAFSAGTPYMLATAALLGARATSAAILGGLGPVDRPGALVGMPPATVEEFIAAREAPDRLPELLSRAKPPPAMPPEELEAIAATSEMLDMMLANHEEMTRQGHAGVLCDHLAFAGDWGFTFEEVRLPVHLWHGESDPLVPIHHSEFVAARLPRATLHRCPNEGHFEMFARQREVLTTLLRYD